MFEHEEELLKAALEEFESNGGVLSVDTYMKLTNEGFNVDVLIEEWEARGLSE